METGLKKTDSMALKGIAILLMVFHHCYRTEEKFAGYSISFFPFSQTSVIEFGLYAKICVSIFAFVSGYGLMYGYSKLPKDRSENAVTKWVGTHIISTLSGYWFVAPLGYIFYGCINGFQFEKWGDTRFEKVFMIVADCTGLSGIFDTKSVNGAWWYIGAAVIFVVLIPFFALIMEKFGFLACALLIAFASRIMGLGFLGGSMAYSFSLILLFGMAACRYDFFEKVHTWRPLESERACDIVKFVMLLFLVLFGVWSCGKIKLSTFWEYKFAIIPFIVIVFCVEYIFRIQPLKTLLVFLGKHSTNVWLVHTFIRDYGGKYVWSVKYFLLVPVVILGTALIISIGINYLKKITGYDKLMQKVLNVMR